MLNTMVSSTAGEMSPAHPSSQEVIYSPVPQHNNTSTPPHMLSCEYHPAYGPYAGNECTYYAPAPGHESYTFMSPQDGSYAPHLVNIEYGPMTVPMVSTNSTPPIPLPMQVPQGHVVQQIVDESGTLRHVIVSPQPPLMPIPGYGPSGSQNQPYYGGGYSGGPYTPIPCGTHSTHSGPSTPPSSNGVGAGGYHMPAHKDERAQRQFVKLRRKFEQTRRDRENSSYQNHYHQNGSYKRGEHVLDGTFNNNNNNTRRPTTNGSTKATNGGLEEEGSVGSTGSVGSSGTQDEEEEHRIMQQTELLSTLIPPVISDVTARSAFIKWSHPDRFTETGDNKFPDLDVSDTEFRYEVFISDRTRNERFKSIFLGTALSCRVKDLKPGTLYAIQYIGMLNDVKGNASACTTFTTTAAEPDAPASPKALSRYRTSISFKWGPPLNDNGSKITAYLLEYDEGKGGSHFVEVFRGKSKTFTVPKLQPAFSYQFRLAAINQCGQSRYSPVTTVMTTGSPPSQPLPPIPAEIGVTFLTLEWRSRPTDDQYTLQMEDPHTGHGFLSAYCGNAPHYTCVGLKGNTPYRFRVKAQNEEGHSKWSDDVVIQTLPDRPAQPRKPILKGRIHSSCFKVRWEPPIDDGVPISAYSLEIDQGNGRFEEIYRGPDHEFLVDNLNPGQSYPLRVSAIGVGGHSDPSDPCVITTEPVCPGKCYIPQVVGKPKSNSVHLKWSSPDWDGGSPINQYEVGCTTPDNQTQEAYRGKETYCFVNRLLPGRSYVFQIRAYNRIGAGPWSEPLELISGAGQPDTPLPPKVCNKSSHSLTISWTEPLNNGSAITEYRVQMATLFIPARPQTPPSCENTSEEPKESEAEKVIEPAADVDSTDSQAPAEAAMPVKPIVEEEATLTSFNQVFVGAALSCEVKGLQPATTYLFRVQAGNLAGLSEWSQVTNHQMPASSPSGVTNVEGIASASSVSLSWDCPASNGSTILHYNITMGEIVMISESTSYTIENLMPDTQYKIRVQAVNGIGPGPFSSGLKVLTKSLPPQPPRLELVSSAHSWMKLKWTETSHKNIEYIVQMINPYHDEFQVVYRGSAPNCKISRLTEDTEYQYRICALNTAGQGPFSDMCRFRTLKAPPPQVKGLKSTLLKEMAITRFEWAELGVPNEVTYQFQVAKKKDQEYKTMYRGETRKYDLQNEDLDAGIDYISRVCAIRNCEEGTTLIGPYSSLVNFRIPLEKVEESPSANSVPTSSFKSNLSTTAQALEDKMNSISYESRVGIMAVLTLIIIALVISMITHHVVS